jgi:phage FluMu gp28-like protein
MGELTLKQKIAIEKVRCQKDPIYAIESYLTTFDQTNEGFVPFKLFHGQKDLIRNYEQFPMNLTVKYRQAGITTVSAGYCAVKAAFADSNKPERILLLANKQDTAIEMLAKCIAFLKQLPVWAGTSEFKKDSSKHIVLRNGSQIKAVATSTDALRGYTPTILIIDEAAYVEGGETFWTACLASLSTGGKASHRRMV